MGPAGQAGSSQRCPAPLVEPGDETLVLGPLLLGDPGDALAEAEYPAKHPEVLPGGGDTLQIAEHPCHDAQLGCRVQERVVPRGSARHRMVQPTTVPHAEQPSPVERIDEHVGVHFVPTEEVTRHRDPPQRNSRPPTNLDRYYSQGDRDTDAALEDPV